LRNTPPPFEAVPTSGLFEGLPGDSIKMMLERASRNDYAPGHWFYMQGQPPRDFYFLESGLVRLSHSTSSGEDVLARFVAPGEVFGYFALVLGAVNVASARVVQPSRIIVWERAAALELLQEIPRAAANLFAIAVRDVAYFYDRTQRLLREGVAKRVEWALSELARTVGKKATGGIVIEFGAGQRELAELAGTTIYTVSRELSKLERQGIVQKERGRIIILKPEKLA
jgi:CRP/FNR family transcriptional regulator, nitrogen oxide reductase regulator